MSQEDDMRLERLFYRAEVLVRERTSRPRYSLPGSGPCSDSKSRLTCANVCRAWSSVVRSWVAMTLVRRRAPAGGTAGWIMTLTKTPASYSAFHRNAAFQ